MKKPGDGGSVLPDRIEKGHKRYRPLKERHINVIKNYVKNQGKGGMKKAMLDAGYALNTALQPKLLTRKPEFRQALESIMSADFIIECLNEDILAKPGNRIAELNLASKIRGMCIDRSEQLVKTINIDISEAVARKNNLIGKTVAPDKKIEDSDIPLIEQMDSNKG
jgi:hypothetical protein